MNVRRLFLHCLDENQVDDFDDGRLFTIGREPVEIDLIVPRRLHFHIACIRFGDLLEHLAHVRGVMHPPREHVADCPLRRDHWHDFELHAPLHIVYREHIGRIDHRHEKLAVKACDRDQLVRLRHVARHQRHHVLRHAQFREIDQRRVEATAHGYRHVLIRHELAVRQNLEQPATFLLLNADRFLELVREKKTVLDQDIGDPFGERFASHRRREH